MVHSTEVSTSKPYCFLFKQECHDAKDCSNPPSPNLTYATAEKQIKIMKRRNKQTRDRTHEYTNPANMPQYFKHNWTRSHQQPLEDPTWNRLFNRLQQTTICGYRFRLRRRKKYHFLLPTNSKTTSTGNIKESTSNTIIKRPRLSQSLSKISEKIDEMLKPLEPTLDDTKSNNILNYCQFKCLLENACGTGNPIAIIKDHTQDSRALLHMIETIHPLLKDRSLKNRIRGPAKKLTQARQTTIAERSDFSDTFLHEIFPIFN